MQSVNLTGPAKDRSGTQLFYHRRDSRWYCRIYQFRDVIFAVDFGTNCLLISLAAILLGRGMIIETRCRRQLFVSTLVGLPELKSENGSTELLKDGIYSQVRRPRYA